MFALEQIFCMWSSILKDMGVSGRSGALMTWSQIGDKINFKSIKKCYCGKTLTENSVQFSSVVQSCANFLSPWTVAHQASLSINNSQSLLKLMSIESVMISNHLILCRPLLLPPSIFPSIRVFSNVSSLHQVAIVWEFQLQHQSFQ